MSCPAIFTGDAFLQRTLTHIDCQAQLLGSYGYLALGEPGSSASVLLSGLLTLFVALFGFRLMFGNPPDAQDLVLAVLKVGIVITLAFSWPAFRTLVYNVVLVGPAEIANAIMAASDGQGTANLAERLQRVDTQIVKFTEAGTGRTVGAFLDGSQPGGTFEASVLEDESTLGFARLSYLAGVVGSLALLRLAGGLLLAIAPIVAGLLLFGFSRSIFVGWVKGLVLTILGSIGAVIVLSVQLAILEPWLTDALRVRTAGYATPSAPIELLAINLAFAFVLVGMTWFLSRVAFQASWPVLASYRADESAKPERSARNERGTAGDQQSSTQRNVSRSVERAILRQESQNSQTSSTRTIRSVEGDAPRGRPSDRRGSQPLGETYRRTTHRRSSLATKRERRT